MIKVGDRIRDVEDSDCYFEGIVTALSPFSYLCDKVVWNGEEDNGDPVGCEVYKQWWVIQKHVDGKWIDVPSKWKITVEN